MNRWPGVTLAAVALVGLLADLGVAGLGTAWRQHHLPARAWRGRMAADPARAT